MSAASVRDYAAVTGAYWGFTLTDGALRMLVLLHFHALGFSPLDLALLFLLYEAMGIVTNFLGGWIGARFGLRLTLLSGLATQVAALLMLSANDPNWTLGLSVAYVMAAQALSGVAKDLTKMSSKSAVKLVAGDVDASGGSPLFRWVAILTGSKNALKGVGFFLGGFLLQAAGFVLALWIMAGALALVLLSVGLFVKTDLGKAKQKITKRDLFAKTPQINLLSFARIFLFASRDVWFVVGLPIFLYEALGWSFNQVGAFMAAWVIGYGFIQASAPKLLRRGQDAARATQAARGWGLALCVVPALIAWGLWAEAAAPEAILIGGLFLFGALFAVNSSLHSYLIVAFSDHDKVALNVGFYYMANAVGRFAGTFLSGAVYQAYGLEACLLVSAAMVLVAAASVFLISADRHTPYPS